MTLLFWFGKEKLDALFDSNIRTRSETTEKRQASSDRIVRMCHVIGRGNVGGLGGRRSPLTINFLKGRHLAPCLRG
jgi:hypothetical protein